MNILERLRDPVLLEQMSLGEKLGGALVVTVIGMLVCMVALTAIMYSIKLMHVIFREKEAPVGAAPEAPEAPEAPALPDIPADAAAILSPAAGTVTALNAFAGAKVQEGDVLLLLEAGGASYEIPAPCAGTVVSLCVNAGDAVLTDSALVIFREKEGR